MMIMNWRNGSTAKLLMVLLNAGTTRVVHTMEKFGHVANKIRAFKVTKFRFSSAVNQSF